MKSYAVNILNFVQYTIPFFLRNSRILSYIKAMIKPIQELNDKFVIWSDAQKYNVAHTSQVIYLEKLLNDQFDNIDRRIYIGDIDTIHVNYIRQKAEQRENLYLRRESEMIDSFVIRDYNNDNQLHFKIIFPSSFVITPSIERKVNAWVDIRKVAGKKYHLVNE